LAFKNEKCGMFLGFAVIKAGGKDVYIEK